MHSTWVPLKWCAVLSTTPLSLSLPMRHMRIDDAYAHVGSPLSKVISDTFSPSSPRTGLPAPNICADMWPSTAMDGSVASARAASGLTSGRRLGPLYSVCNSDDSNSLSSLVETSCGVMAAEGPVENWLFWTVSNLQGKSVFPAWHNGSQISFKQRVTQLPIDIYIYIYLYI